MAPLSQHAPSEAGAEADDAMGHLLIQRDGTTEQCIAIGDGVCTIGQFGHADIALADPSVAALHVALHRREGGLHMRDLTNAFDANVAHGWREVRPGADIPVGRYVVRYVDDAAVRATVNRLLLQSACVLELAAEEAPAQDACMRLVKGERVGRVVTMRGDVLNIRRAGTLLASIHRTSTRFVLEPSDQPIRLNGALVTGPVAPLNCGDLVELCGSVFEFLYQPIQA